MAPAALGFIWQFFPRKKQTLLIVKNDGIGDYILFRNFLRVIRNAEKFRGHKIYVLANVNSKDLALCLDSDIVEKFYWYSDHYFMKWDLIKLLASLQRLRVETIFYPNYSRRFTVDWLINKMIAKNKIAVDGDTLNETNEQKIRSNKYYSRLIPAVNTPAHEFDRDKMIVEELTGEKCILEAPYIEREKLDISPNNSIVVFTGASTSAKTWQASSFNQLFKKITQDSALHLTIVNGKDDHSKALELTTGLPENRAVMLSDLDMIGLCELVGGAKLLVSGDTAAIHIAAALSVPAVCIAKGDLYGRFIPYPRHINANIRCVFPPGFDEDNRNYDQYTPCQIADICPEMVFDAIEKILAPIKANQL